MPLFCFSARGRSVVVPNLPLETVVGPVAGPVVGTLHRSRLSSRCCTRQWPPVVVSVIGSGLSRAIGYHQSENGSSSAMHRSHKFAKHSIRAIQRHVTIAIYTATPKHRILKQGLVL